MDGVTSNASFPPKAVTRRTSALAPLRTLCASRQGWSHPLDSLRQAGNLNAEFSDSQPVQYNLPVRLLRKLLLNLQSPPHAVRYVGPRPDDFCFDGAERLCKRSGVSVRRYTVDRPPSRGGPLTRFVYGLVQDQPIANAASDAVDTHVNWPADDLAQLAFAVRPTFEETDGIERPRAIRRQHGGALAACEGTSCKGDRDDANAKGHVEQTRGHRLSAHKPLEHRKELRAVPIGTTGIPLG